MNCGGPHPKAAYQLRSQMMPPNPRQIELKKEPRSILELPGRLDPRSDLLGWGISPAICWSATSAVLRRFDNSGAGKCCPDVLARARSGTRAYWLTHVLAHARSGSRRRHRPRHRPKAARAPPAPQPNLPQNFGNAAVGAGPGDCPGVPKNSHRRSEFLGSADRVAGRRERVQTCAAVTPAIL